MHGEPSTSRRRSTSVFTSFYDRKLQTWNFHYLPLQRIVHENGTRIEVGSQILNNGVYEADEILILKRLSDELRKSRNRDIIAVDVGATNVTASQVIVSDTDTPALVPQLDPTRPASFGSLEIEERSTGENIGQVIDYVSSGEVVRSITVDHLSFFQLDLLKIDVEGMELKVLKGATKTIM